MNKELDELTKSLLRKQEEREKASREKHKIQPTEPPEITIAME